MGQATLLAALALQLTLTSRSAEVPSTSGASNEDLSEVVVTARRVEERAQDVPISMTIFNQQQLTDRNIVTAGDLAAYTPSVSVDNLFGQDVTSFAIRGFVQALQTTPSVAVYFGDAVVPRGGNTGQNAGSGVAPGSFFDLQNVQVLKGPQGTLFGRNTDGGAVLLVPKKPASEFEAYVEGSYGNYSLGQVQAVLNIPVSDDLRVRLGVNHEQRHGYLDNISGIGPSNFSDLDYTAARLSVVWDLTSNVENYLLGTYNLSVNNGPLWQLFACNQSTTLSEASIIGSSFCPPNLTTQQAAGPYAVQNSLPGAESYLRQMQLIDTLTWHINDALTVKNIANYGQLLTSLDTAILGVNFQGGPLGFPPGVPVVAVIDSPTYGGWTTTDQYTWSDELQLHGDYLDNRLTWQGGGYIEKSAPRGGTTGSRSASILSCQDLATFTCFGVGQATDDISSVHFSSVSAYAQGSYKILDQLKFTGGIRYTTDDSTASVNQLLYKFPTANVPVASCTSPTASLTNHCEQFYRQDSSDPTYMADLDYTPVEDVMIYAKYARGYRQGGIATFVADEYHLYKPEHVNSYELGVKTAFHGAVNGIFNIDAFYNHFTDQQLLVAFTGDLGVTPVQGVVNAGTSQIWGIEVESAISPVRRVTLGLGYTYLNTRLESLAPTPLPAGGRFTDIQVPSAVGGVLPYSPRHKLSANASYQLPIPDTLGNLAVNAIFTYTASQLVTVESPYGIVPPYGLLNMNLTWNSIAGSKIDGELFASNITDRLYYDNYDQFYNALGTGIRYPGEPRMYGARVRINFGTH
jgi:iron complex outermembrane receptor protein